MHAMLPRLEQSDFPQVVRGELETLQVNLGYRCNQACLHCHVNAGPHRKEMMEAETIGLVEAVLERRAIRTLDLTGGAPELNPHFRRLVRYAREIGVHVIDRCNLTVLELPGHEDLTKFLAERAVEITASLPCYLEENVDHQRGKGVFAGSVRVLQRLNALGYGVPGTGLILSLVYNPTGPFLPPDQAELEQTYRRELEKRFGIVFSRLYTLTNMPIQRFGSTLISTGQFGRYMTLLKEAHRDANVPHVMCRSTISVDWRGFLFDCDFNQMLGIPLGGGRGRKLHLTDLLSLEPSGCAVAVADHCYGCTAGAGSSCTGALQSM